MYRLSFFVLFLSFCVISCNSDDTNNTENEQTNFFALSVGNTWEYDVSRYSESQDDYIPMDIVITNTISEQTIINGETYFTYSTTSEGSDDCVHCIADIGNKTVRDSLGYLIDEQGLILFSKSETDDYLLSSNTWGDIFGTFVGGNIPISTPAGEFEAFQNDRYVVLPDGEQAPGTDSQHISENVGTVQKTIALVGQSQPLYLITLRSYTLVE
ncbi:MAG: hypothetical protein Aureis2KO_28550 [Aureisphaera sp.]